MSGTRAEEPSRATSLEPDDSPDADESGEMTTPTVETSRATQTSGANDVARASLSARLRPWEAAKLLEWLAAELRRGEIVTECDGAVVRFPLQEPLRLRVSAERQPVGGRLRLRLYWESTDHGPIAIEFD